MKILLDTNALIDLVAVRGPYVNDIKKLCLAAVFGDLQIWASTQSYADAYYVLRKHAPAEEVKHALQQRWIFSWCVAPMQQIFVEHWSPTGAI